jgi:capsular polysaccharide biosynthesis protein
MTLGELDRQIGVLQTRYHDLIENSDRAKINEQTSRSVYVLVLTPAQVARPQNTRDYVRLALAPAFSLVVGVGLAFFIDGLDNRMRTPGQAEESLELPVLASIRERRRKSG